MFKQETVQNIIEDCRLRAKLFRDRHSGHAIGKAVVKLSLAGVDGGGLSTFGKSVCIYPDDRYECHEDYLYVYRIYSDYNISMSRREEVESVKFVAYESIITIECASVAAVE